MTAAPALRRDADDITDHDLVARVRGGDDRAFERLYTRYHRRIASYIQGMVHDHARAEDIAQDVFMSALRRMRETDRAIAFKPWVYEIAKNACIDQFRRARRAEEVSMDADEGLGSADYGRLVSSTPTPDVAADHKQQIDHLRGAFGGLSETHHEILVMRELEGLSYREIGEKLGMTRPAVESTLFRARRRLTEEYDQLVTGERCVRVQQIIASAGGSSLGARDKRRVARHVSYCQPCLRHARVSGIDATDLVHAKPIRQKIAALLPLPAFLKERWSGAEVNASLAQWSAQASTVDPGLVSSWGKAAATAATIALAGVSAGVATDDSGRLRGALPAVSLESITGTGNPGGATSRDDFQAGSGSGSGSSGGVAAGSSRAAADRGAAATRAGDAGRRGTSTTADGGASGAGDAARDGSGTLAAAGGETAGQGGGGGDSAAAGDDGEAGQLIPSLSGSTGGGDSGGGGGDDASGDDGDAVSGVVSGIPTEAPASSGGGSSDSSSDPSATSDGGGHGGDGGDGSASEDADVVSDLGDKSAEIIGGLTDGG